MYEIVWDPETGGILLREVGTEGLKGSIRPVFHEELDLLGFGEKWRYPRSEAPLLWATTVGRRYYYRGECVAEARGGSFFQAPTIHYFREELELEPVAVPAMLAKNAELLRNLAHEAITFIRRTYDRQRRRTDIAAVAFSGGKDSLVLLDLVQRALRPDEFVVVFNDTQMEISPTYEAVEKAKAHWPHLRFYTTRCHKPPEQTWREFGPPSRIHRWCCSVHKTVPNLLLLRQLAGNPAARALIFDGVRWEESPARAGYERITQGGKHGTQINVSPIIKWNAGEIYLYLFWRDIFLNEGYKYGFGRIGCAVCPNGSRWYNALVWLRYYNECISMINILKEYYKKGNGEEIEFIASGAWKGRAGGKNLCEKSKILKLSNEREIRYIIENPVLNLDSLLIVIGNNYHFGNDKILVNKNSINIEIHRSKREDLLTVIVNISNNKDSNLIRILDSLINKCAYCVYCKNCEIECPTGAIRIENDSYKIDANRCTRCHKCLTFNDKGCLVANSLHVTNGANMRKGLSRYQRFGLRKEWLADFFSDPDGWFSNNRLGNIQFQVMKIWLRELEIISIDNQLTKMGRLIKDIGLDKDLSWLIIMINLAYNSKLINWFINNTHWNKNYSKDDLLELLGKPLSITSRKNAINTIISFFRYTPLGNSLRYGIIDKKDSNKTYIKRVGMLENTNPIGILYSIYRFAEFKNKYDLSLSEIYIGENGIYNLFGISKDLFIKILRGLSFKYNNLISIEIIKDLDNIYLNRRYNPVEVIMQCLDP